MPESRRRAPVMIRFHAKPPVALLSLMLLSCVLFRGCTVPEKVPVTTSENALFRVPPDRYPRFGDDMNYDGLEHSLLKSLEYLKRLPPDRKFAFGSDRFDASHLIRSLEYFLAFIRSRPPQKELQPFIARYFRVYRSVGTGAGQRVLFTGYYEPMLKGSLEPGPIYNIPVYSRPDDLVSIDLSRFSAEFKGRKIIGRYTGQTVVPYPDRKAITENGRLENASPIAWVKDPVDLFFLQIQGSGKIYLDSGRALHVHYHTTNGHPYRSIGKLLIEQNKVSREQMSMQKIREYLNDHPGEMQDIFNYNPSYVFFKIEKDGPLGALNVTLTPGRSIASDLRLFPRSALAFIKTEKPALTGGGDIRNWSAFSRFVLNQDTGGAIRGPGRADLFHGSGPYAEIAAGHMQHSGSVYFLVLDPDAG